MESDYLSEGKITEYTNSEVLKHILTGLYTIISRRTSRNYSLMILSDILKTLKDKFLFLEFVKIVSYELEEVGEGVVDILLDIDRIDPAEVGRAIESIVRVSSMNMKDKDAGLYIITELKDIINDKYKPDLRRRGVDVDLIQIEQHYSYKQRRRENKVPSGYRKIKPKIKTQSKFASLANYSWEKVAFWEYEKNICTIYDKKGKILDKVPLDQIIKDYIMEVTGIDKLTENTKKIVELNEKEYEFIQLLYSKDMNAEEARQLLHISERELSIVIRKLLVHEVLQYVEFNTVSLTEIGVNKLIKKQK